MKQAIGIIAASLSFFSALAAASSSKMVEKNWKGIVNISVNQGTSTFAYSPVSVLRPAKGDLLRVTIPIQCAPTHIQNITLYTREVETRTLLIVSHSDMPVFQDQNEAGDTRFYFEVNQGKPVELSDIGMNLNVPCVDGCRIRFETALSNEVQNPTPQPHEGCPPKVDCSFEIDKTRFCHARSKAKDPNVPSFIEYSRVGSDNQCFVTSRLQKQICKTSLSPEDFEIRCE